MLGACLERGYFWGHIFLGSLPIERGGFDLLDERSVTDIRRSHRRWYCRHVSYRFICEVCLPIFEKKITNGRFLPVKLQLDLTVTPLYLIQTAREEKDWGGDIQISP